MTAADAGGRFARDTAEHVMTVLHDAGLYRHVRFAKPGTSFYWFELITTPGQLTIRGDMGCFVFSRAMDMFDFFDTGHDVNPQYWAEKLVADCGYRNYSAELAERHIRERVTEWQPELTDAQRRALWAAVEESVLCEIEDEPSLRDALMDFKFEGQCFHDSWEWDLRDFTNRYLWCCHAIQRGIERYRKGAP